MNIQQIETAISALPENDFWQLARWLEDSFAAKWDAQIAADFNSGKLNGLIDEARAEHKHYKKLRLENANCLAFSQVSQVSLNNLCGLNDDICLPAARKRFLRFLAGKLRQLAAVSGGGFIELQCLRTSANNKQRTTNN